MRAKTVWNRSLPGVGAKRMHAAYINAIDRKGGVKLEDLLTWLPGMLTLLAEQSQEEKARVLHDPTTLFRTSRRKRLDRYRYRRSCVLEQEAQCRRAKRQRCMKQEEIRHITKCVRRELPLGLRDDLWENFVSPTLPAVTKQRLSWEMLVTTNRQLAARVAAENCNMKMLLHMQSKWATTREHNPVHWFIEQGLATVTEMAVPGRSFRKRLPPTPEMWDFVAGNSTLERYVLQRAIQQGALITVAYVVQNHFPPVFANWRYFIARALASAPLAAREEALRLHLANRHQMVMAWLCDVKHKIIQHVSREDVRWALRLLTTCEVPLTQQLAVDKMLDTLSRAASPTGVFLLMADGMAPCSPSFNALRKALLSTYHKASPRLARVLCNAMQRVASCRGVHSAESTVSPALIAMLRYLCKCHPHGQIWNVDVAVARCARRAVAQGLA